MSGRNKRKLRVGVTLFIRKGPQSFWENGIFQNCIFLVQLLQQCPEVTEVVLVNGGDGTDEDAQRFLGEYAVSVIDMTTAMHKLDVVFEMSAQVGVEWAAQFRSRGGSLISMCVGNNYVIDVERMVHDKPPCALTSGTKYDAIWTLREYENSCKPLYEVAWRAPVQIVTHLWRPDMVERTIAKLPGRSFKYEPKRSWNIGIFEPNICMVKTCHTPLLAAEVAYRLNPASMNAVRVFSGDVIKNHPTFVDFARSLDIVKHNIATFDGRVLVPEAMGAFADAVISHHWENGQNYLWYEMLWGGYPLIHNSTMMGGCGYYYADFDCEGGGLAYLRARKEHDENLANYRAEASAFLKTLDPLNPVNVQEYRLAMLSIVDRRLALAA